jgi:hypothetical protein
MAATKVAAGRSVPDQIATVFRARKEIMKNENLSKQSSLGNLTCFPRRQPLITGHFKGADVQIENLKSKIVNDHLPLGNRPLSSLFFTIANVKNWGNQVAGLGKSLSRFRNGRWDET